jgi:hypothetical protein
MFQHFDGIEMDLKKKKKNYFFNLTFVNLISK